MPTENREISWEIAHVGLCVHDRGAAARFYADIVGLTPAPEGDPQSFSNGFQGLSLFLPDPGFALERQLLHNPLMGKSATIAVPDLNAVQGTLDSAGISSSRIDGIFPGLDRQLFCYDPSMNLIGFTERNDMQSVTDADGWILHHVNLQAHDVRATVGFFTGTTAMVEGTWKAPADKGDFSIDPSELAVLDLGSENRGLHVIRPDAGFGQRNGFAHNPSIGGHPAFRVPDIHAVMRRLEEVGIVYSDAGTYAMTGYHQVYVYDPSFNLIEINQRL
ncbi:hypothetical protein [Nisaea sp.]|uniref:hypothetical protein n=1 Tax=Nisaea sp. TaxID=2024842 RepID=UPI002B275782|nr:hypothetical protein [Nisaea sp.]